MTETAETPTTWVATIDSIELAATILERSIDRGDWDDDFTDQASAAATALRDYDTNVDAADSSSREAAVSLPRDQADELAGILGSDITAAGPLRPFLAALDQALNTQT